MYAQVYLAQGIVEGRARSEQDAALVRTAELARPSTGRRLRDRVHSLTGA